MLTLLIFTVLLAFIVLITSPVWYNKAMGKSLQMPVPQIVTNERQCILPRQEMREKHMVVLNDWRQTVVRTGNRTRIAAAPCPAATEPSTRVATRMIRDIVMVASYAKTDLPRVGCSVPATT